ncbi:MAG: response regulator transcription factor [Bacteroidota bacterium]
MVPQKILIVEDDLHLGFLLMELLESEGFSVKLCRDGETGLQSFKKEQYDCCLLDVMLPETDGFQLAYRIRQENAAIPFLFLTAITLKEDKLRGFTLGAEDYITKPFDEDELLCRIRVILRRYASEDQEKVLPTHFHLGHYVFDYCRQELSYQGVPRRITEKENEVLRLLCLHQNQILKREEAVEKIYGKKDYFLGRSFDVFISRLRKMLKDDPRISIENVFKVGFILNVRQD